MSWRLNSPKFLELNIKGNNNVQDLSGKERHGTFTGTEKYADGPYGHSVMDFDGTNSYIDLPFAAASFMNGQTAFTIELNFNADAAPGRLFDFRDANNDGVLINYDGANTVFCSVNNTDSVSASFAVGGPHHIMFTKEAAGVQTIYVDGDYEDQDDSSAETIAVTSSPRIGIQSFDLTGDYNGKAWGIKLYSMCATWDECIKNFRLAKRGI